MPVVFSPNLSILNSIFCCFICFYIYFRSFILSISTCQDTGFVGEVIYEMAVVQMVQNNDSYQVQRSRRLNEVMFSKSSFWQQCVVFFFYLRRA